MKDVMIGLETLGTVASAVIMSIGAVRFDLETGKLDENGFYASISIDSNLEVGRQISEDTLIWWMGQSEGARAVFTEPKMPLAVALDSFDEWFGDHRTPDKVRVWSNGADFDIPMLAHAYYVLGKSPPWPHFNSRCARTYKNLPCAAKVAKPNAGIAHNALTYAVNQAQHVMAIHAAMTATSKVTA
jgi:hypothetical protein